MIEAPIQRFGSAYARLLIRQITWVMWVFAQTSRLPVVGRCQGAIVDRVLGPAEDFEYVSTTAPSSYPADYIR